MKTKVGSKEPADNFLRVRFMSVAGRPYKMVQFILKRIKRRPWPEIWRILGHGRQKVLDFAGTLRSSQNYPEA